MTSKDLIPFCQPLAVSGELPEQAGPLKQDSRKVIPGDTFIAIRGLQSDGHLHLKEAAKHGAALLIGETARPADIDNTAYIRVKSTRALIGPLAQAFEKDPSRELSVVGVTGTNGKTTVATLVWQALSKMGVQCGLLGTVGKQIGDRHSESRLTTSDPIEIASDLRRMVDAGCRAVAMEVSSHALDQQRTDGIRWSVAAFTNLSHDHIDYHGSMERYISAKRRLFLSLEKDATAVINVDDEQSGEMIRDCQASVVDFGFSDRAGHRFRLLHSGADGIRISTDGLRIRSPMVGRFNASNVAQALLICHALGYDLETVARALETCHGAPGRLEAVTRPEEQGIRPVVFVDYAHTPDALENVASTLSLLRNDDEELVIVFGCGGDRDREKRPRMAKVAETWGDRLIITSDNPRTEEPEQIIRDIQTGLSSDGIKKSITLTSREEAIRHAIRTGTDRSIVLIAGKGHETYQETGTERHPFDDRVIARSALDTSDPSTDRSAGEAL